MTINETCRGSVPTFLMSSFKRKLSAKRFSYLDENLVNLRTTDLTDMQ